MGSISSPFPFESSHLPLSPICCVVDAAEAKTSVDKGLTVITPVSVVSEQVPIVVTVYVKLVGTEILIEVVPEIVTLLVVGLYVCHSRWKSCHNSSVVIPPISKTIGVMSVLAGYFHYIV